MKPNSDSRTMHMYPEAPPVRFDTPVRAAPARPPMVLNMTKASETARELGLTRIVGRKKKSPVGLPYILVADPDHPTVTRPTRPQVPSDGRTVCSRTPYAESIPHVRGPSSDLSGDDRLPPRPVASLRLVRSTAGRAPTRPTNDRPTLRHGIV
jgi:hypothetical protein